MPLTPNEILQKRFGTSLRGLAADEVYAYVRALAEELEHSLQEAATAKADLAKTEEQIEEFRHMETTLRNTLISSQKVSQEIRGEAEHRAELIVREAELEAERRLHEVDTRRAELEQEILRLVAQRRRFEVEFAALIDNHARLLRQNHLVDALESDGPMTPQLPFEDAQGAARKLGAGPSPEGGESGS